MAAVFARSVGAIAQAPVDRVRVFAGTSNSRWQRYPGAAVPFGMVKLSPDNQGNVWNLTPMWTLLARQVAHAALVGGGVLHSVLGATPNTHWGVGP
ncbi:hypothetical protein tb265_24750 [Gemmatimonadetes bacterium T265]|nr:hypothetical protein tb265_24750 [Gemmatimonadetes bacterium T265]